MTTFYEESPCQCPVRLPDTLPPPRCDCQEDLSTKRHCLICHLPFDIEHRLQVKATDFCTCFLGESNVLCWYPPPQVFWMPVYYVCVPTWGRIPENSDMSPLSSLSTGSDHSLVSPLEIAVDDHSLRIESSGAEYSHDFRNDEAGVEYSNSLLKTVDGTEYIPTLMNDESSNVYKHFSTKEAGYSFLPREDSTRINSHSGTSQDVRVECSNLPLNNEASNEYNLEAVHGNIHYISKEIVEEKRRLVSKDDVEVERQSMLLKEEAIHKPSCSPPTDKSVNGHCKPVEPPTNHAFVSRKDKHLFESIQMKDSSVRVSSSERRRSPLLLTHSKSNEKSLESNSTSTEKIPPRKNVGTLARTTNSSNIPLKLGGDVLHCASILSESLVNKSKTSGNHRYSKDTKQIQPDRLNFGSRNDYLLAPETKSVINQKHLNITEKDPKQNVIPFNDITNSSRSFNNRMSNSSLGGNSMQSVFLESRNQRVASRGQSHSKRNLENRTNSKPRDMDNNIINSEPSTSRLLNDSPMSASSSKTLPQFASENSREVYGNLVNNVFSSPFSNNIPFHSSNQTLNFQSPIAEARSVKSVSEKANSINVNQPSMSNSTNNLYTNTQYRSTRNSSFPPGFEPSASVGNAAPGAGNAASGVGNAASGVGNAASGVGNAASGVGNAASGVGNASPGNGNAAPGSDNASPGNGNAAPGSDNAAPGGGNGGQTPRSFRQQDIELFDAIELIRAFNRDLGVKTKSRLNDLIKKQRG